MIVPNGKLIAIGGAELKITKKAPLQEEALHSYLEKGILRRLVTEAGGIEARIEIITTASSIPEERGRDYLASFAKLGCKNLGVMHLQTQKDITEDSFARLKNCNAILFTGGTQRRLSTVFSRTLFLHLLKNRYEQEGLVIAGTSAGAMALGEIMIYKGTAMQTHLKGQVKTTTGFNLLHQVVFDSHFERSGRFARLAHLVALHPSYLGIGLGENTGVVISKGNNMEVIGSGWVTLIDGSKIKHNNIAVIEKNTAPSIENLKVHICASGNGYLIQERKFIQAMNEK